MFPVVLTIILCFVLPVLVYMRRYKALLALAMISAFTEFFNFTLGSFSFSLSFIILLLIMIREQKIIVFSDRWFGKYLWLIWVIMFFVGYYFVLFAPWDDPNMKYRTFTQQLPMRTTVGLIRFLELICIFYLTYFLFRYQYVKYEYFLRVICWIVIVSFVFGFVDYTVTKGAIRLFLMPQHYVLDRFTGLSVEPRSVGQVYGFTILLIIALGLKEKKIKLLYIVTIIFAATGIALSFSSTAIGYLLIVLFLYFLVGRVKIKYAIMAILLIGIGFFYMIRNPDFVEHQEYRIAQVALENYASQIPGVPFWINSFEVFDRTALAFLYLHPGNIPLGVGPNTVNIPANKYLSDYDVEVYKGQIDTAPAVGVVNILSSSGAVGLMIYFLAVFNLLRFALRNNNYYLIDLLFLFLAYFLLNFNPVYFMIMGIVCGNIYRIENEKLEENVVNSNTRA
jgi:hypothetical protein